MFTKWRHPIQQVVSARKETAYAVRSKQALCVVRHYVITIM